MNEQRVWQTIGLAYRAKKIVLGEDDILTAIRQKKAKCVFIANDASDNTKKMYQDKCAFYEVQWHYLGTREQLGHALGKGERVAFALTDSGFLKLMLQHLRND